MLNNLEVILQQAFSLFLSARKYDENFKFKFIYN